jgi:hypothetical protein
MLTACILGFLALMAFSPIKVSGSIYTAGVKAGDWFGYGDVSFEWTSNITGYEQPPVQMNMSWMDAEILDVQNSNVTVRSDTIYEDGTEETYVVWGDIATGEGNTSIMIIPADLGAGDEVPANLTEFTEEPLKLSINGTAIQNYAGADREVNYANITYPIVHGNVTYGAWNMTFYWDRKTGVMCEERVSCAMSYTTNSTYYCMNMSMIFRMSATNMWQVLFSVQDGYAFNITMASNSTISNFSFSESLMQIGFNVTGPMDRAGYCNVTVPKDLLQGDPWTVYINNVNCTTSCDITENDTHTFIYIPYTCSTHTIQIEGTSAVPEFPSAMIIPLFVIATLLLVIAYRRKVPHQHLSCTKAVE